MSRKFFQLIQAMNAITVISFVIFCLHIGSLHSHAEGESGALTVMQQADEGDDNGIFIHLCSLLCHQI